MCVEVIGEVAVANMRRQPFNAIDFCDLIKFVKRFTP